MSYPAIFKRAFAPAAVCAILALVAMSPTPVSAARIAQGAPTPEPIGDGPTPCDMEGEHLVSTRVVEEGGTIDVEASYSFDCSNEETRKVDMMFVVEDTGFLRAAAGGREPLNNLKDALTRLALNLDPHNGTRFGLTRYAEDPFTIVAISSGVEGVDELNRQIQRIRGDLGGASGAAKAIRAASGQLNAVAREDKTVPSLMIVVDAGAPPVGDAALEVENWITSCRAARAEGVTVVTIALFESYGRMRDCASRGWYFRSASEEGADLPAIFEGLGDRIFNNKQVDNIDYNDFLQSAFYKYQDFSGDPREPDNVIFGSDITWSEAIGAGQRGSFRYRYKIDTREGSGGFRSPITIDPGPQIAMFFGDGAIETILLENQEICIFRTGNRERDCGDFELGLTATPVAATATAAALLTPVATETPDGPPPMETPVTPEPSDTPDGPATSETPDVPDPTDTSEPVETPEGVWMIYMPLVMKNQTLSD